MLEKLKSRKWVHIIISHFLFPVLESLSDTTDNSIFLFLPSGKFFVVALYMLSPLNVESVSEPTNNYFSQLFCLAVSFYYALDLTFTKHNTLSVINFGGYK